MKKPLKVYIARVPECRLKAALLAAELATEGIEIVWRWFLEEPDSEKLPETQRLAALNLLQGVSTSNVVVFLGSDDRMSLIALGAARNAGRPVLATNVSFLDQGIFQAAGAIQFSSRRALLQKLVDMNKARLAGTPEQMSIEETKPLVRGKFSLEVPEQRA